MSDTADFRDSTAKLAFALDDLAALPSATREQVVDLFILRLGEGLRSEANAAGILLSDVQIEEIVAATIVRALDIAEAFPRGGRRGH